MTEEKPRRSRAWKILVGLIISVAAAAVGVALWIASVAAHRWEAMEQSIRRLEYEILARPGDRPVLTGIAEPGNAWEDYAKALDVPLAHGDLLRNFLQGRSGSPADQAILKTVLSDPAGILGDLHRGAHRAVAKQLPRERQDWIEESLLDLALLAASRSKALAEEGKGREASETLLDLAQFSRDTGVDVPSIECGASPRICDMALGGLLELDLGGKLTREDRLAVAEALGRLDSSWSDRVLLEDVDVVQIGRGLLQSWHLYAEVHSTMTKTGGEASFWIGWRYGFSDRLIAADAFEQLLEASKGMSAARRSPRPECLKAASEALSALMESRNPYLSANCYRFLHGVGSAQERARIRLLRVALHYRATGEILDLEDPFGGRLRHEVQGSRFKVWSVGPDGVDHGGIGGWSSPSALDIVLEVER